MSAELYLLWYLDLLACVADPPSLRATPPEVQEIIFTYIVSLMPEDSLAIHISQVLLGVADFQLFLGKRSSGL